MTCVKHCWNKYLFTLGTMVKILLFNVVSFTMLRTGFEGAVTNIYHQTNQEKTTKESSLKGYWLRSLSHTVKDCSTLLSADMSQAKNGKLFVVINSTRLRCTHTPCLSTWLHLPFSYRMKILPVVVSIVFCQQKYIICDKVQALSWTDRYPVAWRVRNLWRILA